MFDWLLILLPIWVPGAIIITGVALFVLLKFTTFIPLMYRLPVKIVGTILSIVLFAGGFYLQGRQDILVNAKAEIDKVVTQQQEHRLLAWLGNSGGTRGVKES